MSDVDIKALVFDVFGTVVDWRTSIAQEASILLGKKGFDLDWLKFAEVWRAKYQPAMERIRTGNRGFVRLDILHMENLMVGLAMFLVEKIILEIKVIKYGNLPLIQIIGLK